MEEKKLKEALQTGSEKAFNTIFHLYYEPLCRYIYYLIPDKDESEEISQECLIKLWEKREVAKDIQSLQSYLFKTAHNTCLNKIKHEKVKEKYISEEVYFLKSIIAEEYENTHSPEVIEEIKKAVDTLPEKNKEVFTLRYIDCISTKDVAEKLSISPRTVETHIRKSLRLIREKVQDLITVSFFLFFFSDYVRSFLIDVVMFVR